MNSRPLNQNPKTLAILFASDDEAAARQQ